MSIVALLPAVDRSLSVVHAAFEASSSVPEFTRSRGRRGLEMLLEVHEYACALGGDVWDFALDLRALCRLGLSESDLRWLLCQQMVQHGLETTSPGADRRSFRPAGAIAFRRASCFVLTAAGVGLIRRTVSCSENRPVAANAEFSKIATQAIPTWDEAQLELRFIGKVVKRYSAPAPNQQRILAAFDEEGWPVHIDDPLPPQFGQDPKRRLHDTINSLNRHQLKPLLRFLGDGKGEGVRWQPAMETDSRSSLV